MSDEPKEWLVKCLRDSFVPHGALLLGPKMKSDSIVVLKDDYDAVCKERDQLQAKLAKAVGRVKQALMITTPFAKSATNSKPS